ncbi:MAG: hypothetical protein ACRC2T_05620 [Thermoguttaceae bacterium]
MKMSKKSRQLFLVVLLIVAALLPLGCSLLFFFSRILEKFGDPVTVKLFDMTTAAFFIIWCADLVLLLLVTVWKTLFSEIIIDADKTNTT